MLVFRKSRGPHDSNLHLWKVFSAALKSQFVGRRWIFSGSLQRSYRQLDFTKGQKCHLPDADMRGRSWVTFETDSSPSSPHSSRYTSIKVEKKGIWSKNCLKSQRPRGLQEPCNCVGCDFRGNSCYILICTNQGSQRMFHTKGKHLTSVSKSCLSGRKDGSHPAPGSISPEQRELLSPNLHSFWLHWL